MCERVDYSRPQCSAETHRIPCFCSNNTPSGEQARVDACNQIGISGEWEYKQGAGSTCYHYTNSVVEGGGVVGTTAFCNRKSYKGDVGECCRQPGACFSSNGGTCDPQARSYTGSKCQAYYLNYCSTNNLNDFKARWQTGGTCRRALDENALAGNKQYVAQLGEIMMGTFFHRGAVSEYPGDLQKLVYEICHDTPLACNRYLNEVLCKDFTREDLINLPETRKFCGCHLQDAEYITNVAELGGSQKECDSICVSSINIRPVDSFGDPLFCNRSICIIDSVAIDLIDSTVGEITFSQLCGDCGSGSCLCIIKDVDIKATDSEIGGLNLEQECGGNERCYQTAADGTVVEVDCDLTLPEKQEQANQKVGFNWVWIALSIFLVVAIIFFIAIIFIVAAKKK